MDQNSLSYQQLEDDLARAEAALDAAEVQGLLCGLLCATGRLEPSLWRGELFDEAPDANNLAVRQCLERVEHLGGELQRALHDPELGLSLLLPDDDEPLGDRAEALAAWCDAFLGGIGLGGVQENALSSAEARELLGDLAEIARLAFDAEQAGEADEEDYVQIVEYVRLGVLLLAEELTPLKAPPRLQ
ncbi:YecA family protein [Thiohalobacter sp. IOR34]|uniref:YecA family protein n=1 Tax=Thiohalobacter sp. IOR34 TaxID=3057176 RepID=UPI0025B02902|nr:YecA family protein [Thiohalobacter sp. IOR34]WJW75875.1 YecA family protein [Thiohalobacter sp. IOR34]